ncbi:unnamed protein product [Paramecium sonneborni]|uniref:WD40-repeat-containing domain n=1 Tax=Paramecium sonneborni TaxID=65129 RepID=A0A8S1RKW0_9CILI|nr:unnamed protein product [Paramecium sonneborni]
MINQKKIKIESRQDCEKHQLPICVVVWDKNLDKNERLFCSECMDNLEYNTINVKSYVSAMQLVEQTQSKRREEVSNVIMMSVLQIEKLEKSLNILKQGVVQRLDKMIDICGNWIKNIYQIREQSKVILNFVDELDSLINETKVELDLKLLIDQINKANKSQENKIIERLEQFQEFEETKQCVEYIKGIDQLYVSTKQEEQSLDDNQQYELTQVRDDQDQEQYQEQQKQSQTEENAEFNLIDDYHYQKGDCQVMAFNKSGSIMISTENTRIKIWNYNQGKLKLLDSFWIHKNQITCLVYSKQTDSFVSGSDDKTIICWQQKNQNGLEWIHSFPYQQHTGYVNCLLLNKDEDLLFSGGSDKSINVWHSNFKNNQLIYLYSLNEHSRTVLSLSLNQSETLLASCGYQEFIIWSKTFRDKEKFELLKQQNNIMNTTQFEQLKQNQLPYFQPDKQQFSKSQQKLLIPNGCKIQFITDSQFIWVTDDKSINQVLVFELQDDKFILQNDKTIELIENQQSDDQYYFPIVYNQDKQLILIRHKHHIYLIKNVQDAKFNILASKNCGTAYNYGTMTDDAKYLVSWDKSQKKYQSFEITQSMFLLHLLIFNFYLKIKHYCYYLHKIFIKRIYNQQLYMVLMILILCQDLEKFSYQQ